MEKVRPWCGQPSDRGRLKNRTEPRSWLSVGDERRYDFLLSGRQCVPLSAADTKVSNQITSTVANVTHTHTHV